MDDDGGAIVIWAEISHFGHVDGSISIGLLYHHMSWWDDGRPLLHVKIFMKKIE